MFKVTNCDLQKDIHMTDKNNQDITLQGFVNDIKTIINTARTNAVRSVDLSSKWREFHPPFSRNRA